MIIQNNNQIVTTNITQGTTTTPATTTTQTTVPATSETRSYSDGSFADNKPSVHEQVTSSSDRIMIFRNAGVNHTFTVPSGGLNCDILMIGGGGSDQGGYCGGGAGACIVAINHTLPAGSCIVNVGIGGLLNTNGADSFITIGGAERYRAKGGGRVFQGYSVEGTPGGCGGGAGYSLDNIVRSGGAAVSTNVLNGNITTGTGSTHAVLGNAGGNNGNIGMANTGGGGGIGGKGVDAGKGGDGKYDVAINGTTYNFRNYFANGGNDFGVQDGSTGNYYIGGGGGGHSGTNSAPNGLGWGLPNTGFGGKTSTGGTGIVIIRYKNSVIPLPTITPATPESTTTTSTTTYTHNSTLSPTLSTPTLGTPSIELVRGTQGDSNTDYKIGNYSGDFIVKSSVSGVDSDYIRMLGTNGAIYNFTNSLYWTQTSDMRIKENIARASYDMCYDNIDKLELNRFNYIKEFNTGNKDTSQLGFIAQEIKDIFPKSVYTNSYSGGDLSIPDMLSIDIGQINYTLYGAVKKLMDINKDKEMRLKRLEGLLNIEDGSCNVVVDTSNVMVDTSNVVVDTSNVMVVDTSNLEN